MRADKSKKGKAAWGREKAIYASTHNHIHEGEYPPVTAGSDCIMPETLHVYLLNAGKQLFKQLVVRHGGEHGRERMTAFFKGMNVNLDCKDGGSMTNWVKAEE